MKADRLKGLFALSSVAALLSAALFGCSIEPVPSPQGNAGPSGLPARTSAPSPASVPTPSVSLVPKDTIVPAPPTSIASPAVSPTAGGPTPTPKEPPYWVTQAFSNIYSEAEGFQGVVTVSLNTGSGSPATMTLREWFRRPNLTKLEVLRSQGDQAPPGTILIYDGNAMTIFNPSGDQMLRLSDPTQLDLFLHLPAERFYPMLQLFQLNQAWSGLASQSSITVGPREKVANRDTIRLELTPSIATARFHKLSLWLDKSTNIPLRAQALAPDGSDLLAIDFSQFIPSTWDPQTQVGPEVFSFTPPSRTATVPSSAEGMASFAGLRSLPSVPVETRRGLRVLQPVAPIESTRGRSVWSGSINGSDLIVLMYGDRQEISTLLVEGPTLPRLPMLTGSKPAAEDDLAGVSYQAGNARVVQWVSGNVSLTLVTTLSPDLALEMARSVR